MNRSVRRWICSLLAGVIVSATPYYMIDSFAATAKIAFSDPTTNVGEEVSVTMKFTSTSGDVLGNTDVMLAYNANLLEFLNNTENASGGAGAIRVWTGAEGATEMSTVLRFKALQAGTSSITVTSWEGYDNDGQTLTMEKEGSSSVKITGLQTSSTDASLQSLQISPGTLDPVFTPGVERYTTSVGLDVERLTISAKSNNDKAVVTVEGGTELQAGENTVVCKVTAEDGTTVKSYTVLVNKVEGAQTPEGETSGVTTEGTPEVLASLDVTAKKIQIIALPQGVEIPTGFKESSIVIGEAKVQGWTWAKEETPSYCVFYGINEQGEQSFYRYDLTEKTIQRYFQDPVGEGSVTTEEYVKVANDYNSLIEDFKVRKWIIIGLGALSAVLAVVLGGVLMTKGKPKEKHTEGKPSTEHLPRTRKKLSKEERYMMGVEEEFEDPESFNQESVEDYLPEPADDPGKTEKSQPVMADLEASLTANLAKEAVAATVESEIEVEDDDFEFFDLEDK